MHCTNCGIQLPGDVKFCSGCGKAVARAEQQPPTAPVKRLPNFLLIGCLLIVGFTVLGSIVAVLIRGLAFSVDFKGGAIFTFSAPSQSLSQGQDAALPSPSVVATGPLTGEALARSLAEAVGDSALAFYDAIAPIVAGDSIDHSVAFRQSRYGKGGGDDYLNLPLSREEYERFVDELLLGQKVAPHAFEEPRYFEGCLPIEVMAARGRDVLAFGPMKPVGLHDPRTGRRPHAVVQ